MAIDHKAKTIRNAAIAYYRKYPGGSYSEIGRVFNVSKQRVHQILNPGYLRDARRRYKAKKRASTKAQV